MPSDLSGPAPVGIYGGTFDPVHIGHLRTALEVRERLSLDRVLLVPAGRPAHRAPPAASARQRLAMLRAAVAGVAGLVVEPCELLRPGPSYMVNTLVTLRRRYRAAPLLLILGMDAFVGLPHWHQWRRLGDLAHLLVLARPGAEPDYPPELVEWLGPRQVADPAGLAGAPAGRVCRLSVSQLEVSSTRLRAMFAAGSDPRYLLPDAVHAYIRGAGLYRSPAPGGMALQRLDHLVLTVADIPATVAFYRDLLGMRPIRFGEGRVALRFGPHKINLHQAGAEFTPRAGNPTPGSADLCLVTALSPAAVLERLGRHGVAIEQGPIRRSGALGPIGSVYFRDPDGNLIELASYAASA